MDDQLDLLLDVPGRLGDLLFLMLDVPGMLDAWMALFPR
jgi:hypothetical protein